MLSLYILSTYIYVHENLNVLCRSLFSYEKFSFHLNQNVSAIIILSELNLKLYVSPSKNRQTADPKNISDSTTANPKNILNSKTADPKNILEENQDK